VFLELGWVTIGLTRGAEGQKQFTSKWMMPDMKYAGYRT
jgi:hypothetical protein